MHLSRLWTDTHRKQQFNEYRCRIHQVNQNNQRETSKKKEEMESTSAPVTSVTDTQVQKQFKRETKKGEGVRVHLSRLWTDTEVQKSTRGAVHTKRKRWGAAGKRCKNQGGECECTCHVCGQTHKYKERQ